MRRRVIIGLIFVVIVVAVGISLIVLERSAPVVSGVGVSCIASEQGCLRFPVITGENLPGQTYTLPDDFAGNPTLVIVPFDENQQVEAQTWLPLAQEIEAAHPDFRYYSVPVFPSMAAPMRALIRGGMNITIADAALREITITIFLDDRDQFLRSLDIPNTDAMQVFLLNADGDVLWRGSGAFTTAQENALRAAMNG